MYWVVLLLCILPKLGAAQSAPAAQTTDSAKIANTSLKTDSLQIKSTGDSSSKRNKLEQSLGIRISKDALEEKVNAYATDSAVMDMKSNDFRLYGDAKVDYDGMKLKADHISFNQASNVATAVRITDSTVKKISLPSFERGSEKFTYDHLQYNFKTQRAIVRNAHSQYGEGFVQSVQIKRNADQSLYGWQNVYTTCALDTPHFGIRANKIKIVPDHVIATGSANVIIEGVPTPIFLPFGLFPISESHRSGFVLPGYTIEQARGLGFTRGGYYFYLNDYADLETQADLYTKGSWAGYLTSRYYNKYHYSGNVAFSYAYNKTGEDFDPAATIQKDFAFVWQHQKDPKSLPGINFNANVNIQSGSYYQNNSYNTTQILQNQYSSNISFSKNWQGTPFSLTASATHNQNISSGQVTATLPDITFYMASQNPFKRKVAVGAAKWYEKITVGYTMHALNRITTYDSVLHLSKIALNDFSNGMQHNIPITASYTVLRFINLSFNAAYNEYWYSESDRKAYNDITGKIDTTINRGFITARDFNAGMTMTTRIYGMVKFKKGKVKGIRHVLTPSLGMSFRPDFAKAPYNYYYQARLDTSQTKQLISPYEMSVIGMPPSGRSGSITMGLNNNLQMKVRSSKDTNTGFKNITLLDALSINTAYNLAVDSFQWSPITIAARTNIIDKISFSGNANFDPYAIDYSNGRRTASTLYSEGKGIARLTNATAALSASFHSSKGSKPATPQVNVPNAQESDYTRLMRNNGYQNYVDFNVPWNVNLSYALSLNKIPSIYSHSDTSVVSQNIIIGGDFNLTPLWKVAFNTGYDITMKQVTLSSIDIYRDLHCWEMRLGLIPFGTRKSFNFSLNVKAQILHDMRLLRRRDYRDAVY